LDALSVRAAQPFRKRNRVPPQRKSLREIGWLSEDPTVVNRNLSSPFVEAVHRQQSGHIMQSPEYGWEVRSKSAGVPSCCQSADAPTLASSIFI
jgi:hypothetical protein